MRVDRLPEGSLRKAEISGVCIAGGSRLEGNIFEFQVDWVVCVDSAAYRNLQSDMLGRFKEL